MRRLTLPGAEQRRREDEAARVWRGGYRPYDLVKEATMAFGVVVALVGVLAILFSSPDERSSTIRTWARTAPVDFVTTATSELDGSSASAGYGPPYNHASSGQHIAFIHLAKWVGANIRIDPARDFVLAPLSAIPGRPDLQAARAVYETAPAAQQAAWTAAYSKALASAKVGPGDGIVVAPGHYGPVATIMAGLLGYAQSGGLDGALLSNRQFYSTDYTKPLLFLADGGILAGRAQAEHLLGTQWGMMNETGSYPGQVWLWLYTFWYQIKPFSTSANADILVMAVMGVLSLAFVCIPLLPGIRSIPRRIPVYRIIWREHYRALALGRPRPGPDTVDELPPAALPHAS